MAKIPLRSGFTLMPEGVRILRCEQVDYDENFGKLVMTFKDKEGNSLRETFNLQDANGEWNEKALSAFSFTAKALLGKDDVEECDPQECVGKYMEAEIVHNPGKKDGSMFANLGREKHHAEAFEGEEPLPFNTEDNLDDILGV